MKTRSKRKRTMTASVKQYVQYRRSFGFELKATRVILLDFARFVDRGEVREPLTADLMLRWATRNTEHSARYHAARLSAVRGFARYLLARGEPCEIPGKRLLPKNQSRQQPHIYTDKQLHRLIKAAASLQATYPLRPHTFSTLLGLLSSTGLRVSEALSRTDVDLGTGVLHIRQTKFKKSRLVPMHPTVIVAMERYARHRDREKLGHASEFFFVGREGGSMPYRTLAQTFRRLCDHLDLQSNGVLARPRIHDLRHSFACRRLLQWYRDGVDIDHSIVSLSTYMGHGKVTDTYWYLSGTGELLAIAGERFGKYATSIGSTP